MKPVLFISGHVPASRSGAYAALHARIPIELALFGGRHQHGAPPGPPPAGVPSRSVSQREIGELVSGGDWSAVIAGTGGRVALPLAWRAARRRRLPFVFWAALWRTPRVAAHVAAIPLMRQIYREASAVVTYGSHVSAYVEARGARRVFVAPQAVDNEYWSAPTDEHRGPHLAVLFVGRADRAKGLHVLLEGWREAAFEPHEATLTVVGRGTPKIPGIRIAGELDADALRNFYAASDVVVVPSIATRRFIEPWGLVVNEGMNQQCAIIASDAVGAAAGGLVRHERNGLVVAGGQPQALAGALRRLAVDRVQCAAFGCAGAEDVSAYTYDAWAEGFSSALESAWCASGAGKLEP